MGNIRLGDVPASTELRSQSLQNGVLASIADANFPSRASSRSPSDPNTPTSDGAATQDATRPAKLSRKVSQKHFKREPPLFDHLPDATEEACRNFKVIPDCLYGSKNMGSTDNDALDCDCKEDWHDGVNYACGEDCINRATRVECVIGASGSCGDGCQNQRFQRKQYADLSVIKTEKKGYGLRANTDLEANDFVHEYVGEVINEPTFRRRMHQYDDEGIKHFYFMSLTKSEFVDATKKGNLGRFCNHSCNPNCYVDKWVVGDKMRMGIFVLRKIKAGEELTFNYNVDRYGADPQPCYCGEPECSGFIGGKTQTEKATKLPILVIEALGIDDADGWDTSVSKKPRKKRSDEDDEEYVNSVQAKSLDLPGARKVMAALMQCKEKWIAVKLLERIQNCDDDYVLNSVMRMHAYQIMKTMINSFMDDDNVLLQVLNVLDKMPRLTKNKIVDSNIEATVLGLTESQNEDVADASRRLLDDWDKLQVAYRIKRRKIDANAPNSNLSEVYREAVLGMDRDPDLTTPASKPVSPLPSNIEIPKGPKSSVPQRNFAFPRNRHFNQPRHGYQHPNQTQVRHRHPQQQSMNGQNAGSSLPTGWYVAANDQGKIYYYTEQGMTTWVRPTVKAPTKAELYTQTLQKIIDDAIKAPAEKIGGRSEGANSSHTTPDSEIPSQEAGTEKWRSLPLEKQMKIYENTLFPHVKHVLDKFRHRLPKEELKKFAKELNKKLASSDYKNNRVQDPTAAIPEKQARKIKQYVKEFLDKAVVKFVDFERKKAARDAAKATSNGETGGTGPSYAATTTPGPAADREDVAMTDVTPEADTTPDTGAREPQSPGSPMRKRKREAEDDESPITPVDEPPRSPKRAKELVNVEATPPPPPPPPPPEEEAGGNVGMESMLTEEERDLRAQEEALMRENEEAQRLEDEALGTAPRTETMGNSVSVS